MPNRGLGLTVIVPAFNEERTICKVLCDLIALKVDIPMEIIVLSDGSTDRTASIVLDPLHIFNVRFIENEMNQGKGISSVKV